MGNVRIGRFALVFDDDHVGMVGKQRGELRENERGIAEEVENVGEKGAVALHSLQGLYAIERSHVAVHYADAVRRPGPVRESAKRVERRRIAVDGHDPATVPENGG